MHFLVERCILMQVPQAGTVWGFLGVPGSSSGIQFEKRSLFLPTLFLDAGGRKVWGGSTRVTLQSHGSHPTPPSTGF